jgi:hypothetical protein
LLLTPGAIHQLLRWLEDFAIRDPLAALAVFERLATKLEGVGDPVRLWPTDPVIAGVASILREADQTDDESLIHRAVTLQDRFLRIGIRGIEELFDQASQV